MLLLALGQVRGSGQVLMEQRQPQPEDVLPPFPSPQIIGSGVGLSRQLTSRGVQGLRIHTEESLWAPR